MENMPETLPAADLEEKFCHRNAMKQAGEQNICMCECASERKNCQITQRQKTQQQLCCI